MAGFKGKQDPVQRQRHWNESTTIESFIEHAKGRNLEQLRVEQNIADGAVGNVDSGRGLGPVGHRYLKDPLDPPKDGQPGGVIDMRHFIESANVALGLGEWVGLGVEIDQTRQGFDSGFYEEDFKSNFLGVVFRNNYWEGDADISNEFQSFFEDYRDGNLKGFVPAVEQAIEDAEKLGADGLKQLKSLKGVFGDYLHRLKNSHPVEKLRSIWDRLTSAEQRLEVVAAHQPLIDQIQAKGVTGRDQDLVMAYMLQERGSSVTDVAAAVIATSSVLGEMANNLPDEASEAQGQDYVRAVMDDVGKMQAIAAQDQVVAADPIQDQAVL